MGKIIKALIWLCITVFIVSSLLGGILAGLVSLAVGNFIQGVVILLLCIPLFILLDLWRIFTDKAGNTNTINTTDTSSKLPEFPVFPKFVKEFDISGKRSQNMQEYIRKFCEQNYIEVTEHEIVIFKWAKECYERIQIAAVDSEVKQLWEQSLKLRIDKDKQYAYEFRLVRYYTVSGKGTKKKVIAEQFVCDLEYLKKINGKIGKVTYATNENGEIIAIGAAE